MGEPTDDMLLSMIGSGDRWAFRQLVERHMRTAARIATRMVKNPAEAEDMVQEAFLRAWMKAPTWRAQQSDGGAATFSTWFYRVLVNLCIDRLRRPRAVALDDSVAEIADETPGGEDRLASDETSREVHAAIALLPERQRLALTLCHFEGFSNAEAAAVLEVGVGAVESLLVRARRSLRQSLAGLVEDRVGGTRHGR
jgi:RNA polymerase sigma-70 factor (ECF subfamily)